MGLGSIDVSMAAQTPTPQRSVTAVLVNAQPQPPQPVKAVRVSLEYIDSGVKITEAQQVTNSQGQAQLLVSSDVFQRGEVQVEVTGAADLVIWQPAGGQLPGVGPTVRISLLPKGSPALLGPAQIEAMLHRTLLQLNSLQKENRALKTEVAAAHQQAQSQQQNLGAALAAWAVANGFPAAEVDRQVQQWAQQIQQQSAQATLQQRALAEVALKHYASAAQLFNKAADTDANELDAEEQAFLSARRDKLRQLIADREQAAGAYQLNLQYDLATQTVESAEATAEAEYKKHPDDNGFHELQLRALLAAAKARRSEGEVASADKSVVLIAQAVGDLQSVVAGYTELGDRQQTAAAQVALGNALAAEGGRTSSDQAIPLYDQSAQAYNTALDVYTKAGSPSDWADAQLNLGLSLDEEAERVRGDKAIALLGQAEQAFNRALEVYDKADYPSRWAETQSALGVHFWREGLRFTPAKSVALYDQSIQAFKNALDVITKSDSPLDWAKVQVHLGLALSQKSRIVGVEEARPLLEQSVQANQSALQIITETALPQDWAVLQNDLGAALMTEGFVVPGDKSIEIFAQAAEAFRNSLRVRTRAELPQDWAISQENLGYALWAEGTRTGGEKGVALLEESSESTRKALEVFTKSALPQRWAQAQDFLGDALADESVLTSGPRSAELLHQAIQAIESELDVYTKSEFMGDWAGAQADLAELDLRAGDYSGCQARTDLLTDDTVTNYDVVTRDVLRLACQWGARDKTAARATAETLMSKLPATLRAGGDYTGTIHFLSVLPAFEAGRSSWIALFTALQSADRAGMTAALHQLEPLLQQ
ncbi:MAG: hypothetical protein ACLQG3_14910 [Terracidiphilus sp.]